MNAVHSAEPKTMVFSMLKLFINTFSRYSIYLFIYFSFICLFLFERFQFFLLPIKIKKSKTL